MTVGRRILRWMLRLAAASTVIAILATGAGLLWLRSSLPQLDGELRLPGLEGPVEILRDRYGVPTIRAGNAAGAAFGLGYAHAQDRFAQMELMRRGGSGRMSELVGGMALGFDRYTRGLGLRQQAENQAAALPPDLLRVVEAYAAGVNAWLGARGGALPWELAVLFYEPEPWSVADSLLWGRLMAFRLIGNWRAEALRARMAERLTPEQIADLWPRSAVDDPVTLPGLGSSGASNIWAVGDPTALANDPHLGFTIPNTWYLARVETPEGVLAGATAPGVPFMVLGHNGHIAWGFTTPYIDTADVVTRPEVAAIRREKVAVRWGESIELELRRTRKGVVVSDFSDALPEGWAIESPAFRDDDRTAEALGRLNQARDWPGFLTALGNFHSPQQNIVYADRTGRIGIVTPGRVPDRHGGFVVSGKTAWSDLIPFDELPKRVDPLSGRIVNANNRLVDESYPHYLGREWEAPYRAMRIEALLEAGAPHAAIQNDALSLSARELLPHLLAAVPDVRLQAWDGDMDRRRPEPLIYMAWMREAMRAVFADELGALFDTWWAYRPRILRRALLDRPAWCDDTRTTPEETCKDRLVLAHRRAIAFLQERYGGETPPWGTAHQARFSHPIAGRIPVLRNLLDRKIATSGGPTTVNRGGSRFRDERNPFRHAHGAGYRAIYDLEDLDRSRFIQAVGQSGNPFSPHYDDLMELWRDGAYITLDPAGTPAHHLLLRPE